MSSLSIEKKTEKSKVLRGRAISLKPTLSSRNSKPTFNAYVKLTNNSVIKSNQEAFMKKKLNLQKQIGLLSLSFNERISTIKEAKRVYDYNQRKITVADMAWALFNLITIFVLFYSNSYQGTSKTQLTNQNKIRIACLAMSILTCALIVYRKRLYHKIENLKYLLGLRPSPKHKKQIIAKEILEYIAHIIQPYPFLAYSTKFNFNGNRCQFAIDLLLLIIASFRLYSLCHLMNIISTYASLRAERIYSLYNVKATYGTIYKIEALKNKLVTISITFCLIILFGTSLFCAFETSVMNQGSQVKTWYHCFIFVMQSFTRSIYTYNVNAIILFSWNRRHQTFIVFRKVIRHYTMFDGHSIIFSINFRHFV